MSVAVINFKMKTIDRKVKTAFYLGEAGLDEAYAVIVIEIKNAIENGTDTMDTSYNVWLASQDPNDPDPPTPPLNEWFQQGYKEYIQNNLTSTILNYDYSVLDLDINSASSTVTFNQPINFQATENKYVFELKSSFTHQDITKSIKSQYKIAVPDYSSDLIKKEKILPLIEYTYTDME